MRAKDAVLKVYPNAAAQRIFGGEFAICEDRTLPVKILGKGTRESWAWAEAYREIQRRERSAI